MTHEEWLKETNRLSREADVNAAVAAEFLLDGDLELAHKRAAQYKAARDELQAFLAAHPANTVDNT